MAKPKQIKPFGKQNWEWRNWIAERFDNIA